MTRLVPFLLSTLFASVAFAQPRPVIEQVSPRAGAPGTEVTLIGRHFNAAERIVLGALDMPVVRRLPNRMVVTVPPGATSGSIALLARGARYVGPTFRVIEAPTAPTITGVSPASAPPGAEVVLTGSNLATSASGNRVTFGGRPVIVRLATPTALHVIVPAGVAAGTFRVVAGNMVAESPHFTTTAGLSISNLEPAMAIPGSDLIIHGTGFGSNIRVVGVFINRRSLRLRRVTPTRIVAAVPRGMGGSELMIQVGGEQVTQTIRVGPAPIVRSLSASYGRAGSDLHVLGTGFGSDPNQVAVTVGGRPLTLLSVRPTDLHLRVPRDVSGQELIVSVAGVASAPLPFTVLGALRIDAFSPESGPPGTRVVIQGAGFAQTGTEVFISGHAQQVVSVDERQLVVQVSGELSGPFEVRSAGAAVQASRPFVSQRGLEITSLQPTAGPVGSEVRILGAGFGDRPGLVQAFLGRAPMPIVSVHDQQIRARIPAGAHAGPISVRIGVQGTAVSPTVFSVEAVRRIFSMTPAQAYPGVELTLSGEGFPTHGAEVQFNGVRRPVDARRISPVELRVTVPNGARTGPVQVLLPNSQAMDAGTLTVGAAPSGLAIERIEPQCVNPSCIVVLRGRGFSTNPRGNRVIFEGASATILSASADALQIRLPQRTGNGRFVVRVGRQSAESPPFMIVPATR